MTTTDAEAIARVIDPDAMVATTYIDDIGGRPLLTPSMPRRKEDALGKANRILSYLASRRELEVPEPVYKAVERILDEKSAWIARPNDEVTKSIAFQAVVAAYKIIAEETPRREAQEPTADTGNAEADNLIGRLMSSDPDFDDCTDAAAFIRRLVLAPAGEVERLGPEETLSAEILAELTRARAKFPGKNVTFAALVEEAGELATATFEEGRDRVRKEAVQVAVMAMRMVLDGDHTFDDWRASKGLDCLVPAALNGGRE